MYEQIEHDEPRPTHTELLKAIVGHLQQCVYVCLFSTICRAAPYLLLCWTQIKSFHSNSLSGNRGTLRFIYKPSYVAAETKRFIKVWHLSRRGNMSCSLDILVLCRSIDSVTTCHSITACRTCHKRHNFLHSLCSGHTHPHPIWKPSSVIDNDMCLRG